MPDFSLLQSPRSEGFLAQTDPADEDAIFTQGFCDLAYKALAKAQPALQANVVTFRTLEKDVRTGEAAGAFILRQGAEVIYVPVVLVDNAIKPLDMFYARSQDRYYPLTDKWLRQVARESPSRLGAAVTPPRTVPTDVDLRNIVAPPLIGRFGFASEEDVSGAWLPFARMRRELPDPGGRFLDCVGRAGAGVKLAMQKALQSRPEALAKMAEQYGVSALRGALLVDHTKTAAVVVERPMRKDVYLATATTPVQEMQRELAPGELATAYAHVRRHGFWIKDLRGEHNALLATSPEATTLVAPDEAGLYRFFMADGRTRVGLAIPVPGRGPDGTVDEGYLKCAPWGPRTAPERVRDVVLVLFEDGEFAQLSNLVAEPIPATVGEVQAFVEKRSQPAPTKDGYGTLLTTDRLTVRSLRPFYAHDVRNTDGVASFRGGGHFTRVEGRVGRLLVSRNDVGNTTNVVYGSDYRWWPLGKELYQGAFLTDPRQIWARVESGLAKTGAEKVAVRRTTDGGYIVDGQATYGIRALVKVAEHYGLSIEDAANVIQTVDACAPVALWVKKAADPAAAPPPDPNAMAPMPPPGPPPPTGLDLAVAEKMNLINAQMQALQQQAMMLQEVQQRAMGIDGGGGAMAAPQAAIGMMGAPPPTVLGAPAMAPVPQPGMQPGMPPGMQPGMQPGMPMPMPMQMGVTPQGMPGAPMPGMSPQMAPMGMPPGMQPGMQPGAPPPQPVMDQSPTPETLAQNINPAFLQDAALLGDPQVFDASAVATFVKPRALREIFQNYAPTFDAAVDKLGRALLLTYTQARQLRESLGEEGYRLLEQRIRDVFRALGDALTLLHEFNEHLPDGSPQIT